MIFALYVLVGLTRPLDFLHAELSREARVDLAGKTRFWPKTQQKTFRPKASKRNKQLNDKQQQQTAKRNKQKQQQTNKTKNNNNNTKTKHSTKQKNKSNETKKQRNKTRQTKIQVRQQIKKQKSFRLRCLARRSRTFQRNWWWGLGRHLSQRLDVPGSSQDHSPGEQDATLQSGS